MAVHVPPSRPVLKVQTAWRGDEIRALRETLDMPREAFCRLLGVSAQAVYWWENEEREPGGPACILLTLIYQGECWWTWE